jgi:hypothetical protein
MKSGINPNKSTPIYTNLHQSTRIYTNLHESTQSRFKALQALFLADIAHYNYKGSCGLSKGLKMLASIMHFPIAESCAGGLGNVRIRLRPFTELLCGKWLAPMYHFSSGEA